MVRGSKKCESSEKEAKTKLKKAIEARNTEGARIYAQVGPQRFFLLHVPRHHHPNFHHDPRLGASHALCRHTFGRTIECYPGEDAGLELPETVFKNRCGGGALGKRDTDEAGDGRHGRHCHGHGHGTQGHGCGEGRYAWPARILPPSLCPGTHTRMMMPSSLSSPTHPSLPLSLSAAGQDYGPV